MATEDILLVRDDVPFPAPIYPVRLRPTTVEVIAFATLDIFSLVIRSVSGEVMN